VQFIADSLIRATPQRVFAFHELPDALARLTPAWAGSRILEHAPSLAIGARSIVRLRCAPLIWIRTELVHTVCEPPYYFEDRQETGPFRSWRHCHAMIPVEGGTRLVDTIDYDPPFGILGRLLAPLVIERRLRRLFAYRHEVTRAWCEPPQIRRNLSSALP
jgi:ligand-binding SRPBCC domain-containing protein